MFFLLLLIIVLIVFLIFQKTHGHINKYLIILLLTYFVALGSMILFISKDTYYYYQIRSYFYLPDFLWKWLFFINISKMNIIRLINISSLGVIVVSTYFAFHFIASRTAKYQKPAKIFIWLYALFQFLIYDPFINLKLYYFLYPDWMSVPEYLAMENLIMSTTRALNILIILINLFCLCYALYISPKLNLFRLNYLFISISYAVLSFVYIYFISVTPSFFLKISKISGTHQYRSIRLGTNTLIYQALPFFLIIAVIGITACAYRLNKLTSETTLKELCISREISSSETTSKIFCHYIKNEILAIRSEAELLLAPAQTSSTPEDIIKRCDHLYHRIDEIHRSTKTSELNLKWYSLSLLIKESLHIFSHELENLVLEVNTPREDIFALIDPIYMEQALHNILNNSIDAMTEIPAEKRKLILNMNTANNWIQIEVTDTGKGISRDNLENIFLPFYSSHPYSKHWGIGLTLTYKIVAAHGGKIMAESNPGAGTTLYILLPYVTQEER